MNSKISVFLFLIFLFNFIHCRKDGVDIKPVSQELSKDKYIAEATTFNLVDFDTHFEYQMIRGNDSVIQLIEKQKLPFKNIAVLSSSVIGYFDALNSLENIKVVYNPDWIYSPAIHEMITKGEIQNGGNAASANLETVLADSPDLVIAFSDPNQAKLLESVKKAGIPVLYVDEYLERTPLGKAEYLKLFGALTGKTSKADSLFNVISNNYSQLKNLATQQKHKPTVFTEIMRGDIWYMPGGNSFVSKFLQDAGAQYLWQESDKTGTENLNFEQVFQKAEKADFWLNAGEFTTLNSLQDAYKNHAWFGAFQTGNVFSYTRRTNDAGMNDFFEFGTVRADWVLRDLVHIFHPELLPDHQLYFYLRLQ